MTNHEILRDELIHSFLMEHADADGRIHSGDIISEQIIGALNFNKGFILPGRFAMVETANDPYSILAVDDIDHKAKVFAGSMLGESQDTV